MTVSLGKSKRSDLTKDRRFVVKRSSSSASPAVSKGIQFALTSMSPMSFSSGYPALRIPTVAMVSSLAPWIIAARSRYRVARLSKRFRKSLLAKKANPGACLNVNLAPRGVSSWLLYSATSNPSFCGPVEGAVISDSRLRFCAKMASFCSALQA